MRFKKGELTKEEREDLGFNVSLINLKKIDKKNLKKIANILGIEQ